MDGEAIMSISAAVVTLTQFAKWAGVKPSTGPVMVLLLSTLGVILWGFSEGSYERAKTFEYFVGWLAVVTSAAGVFGFTRGSAESLTQFKRSEQP
jgi:hypothetical protein